MSTPAMAFVSWIGRVLTTFFFLWIMTLVITRIYIFREAYYTESAKVEGEKYLLEHCNDPTFYSNIREHAGICEKVMENARANIFLKALNIMAENTHMCGIHACTDIIHGIIAKLGWQFAALVILLLFICPNLLVWLIRMISMRHIGHKEQHIAWCNEMGILMQQQQQGPTSSSSFIAYPNHPMLPSSQMQQYQQQHLQHVSTPVLAPKSDHDNEQVQWNGNKAVSLYNPQSWFFKQKSNGASRRKNKKKGNRNSFWNFNGKSTMNGHGCTIEEIQEEEEGLGSSNDSGGEKDSGEEGEEDDEMTAADRFGTLDIHYNSQGHNNTPIMACSHNALLHSGIQGGSNSAMGMNNGDMRNRTGNSSNVAANACYSY